MSKPSVIILAFSLVTLLAVIGTLGYDFFSTWRTENDKPRRKVGVDTKKQHEANEVEKEGVVPISHIVSGLPPLCEEELYSVVPLNFDTDSNPEYLVVCGTFDPNTAELYVLQDQRGGYALLWEVSLRNPGEPKGFMFRQSFAPTVIDVDGDGVHEIYWEAITYGVDDLEWKTNPYRIDARYHDAITWGSSYSFSYHIRFLYSSRTKEMFYVHEHRVWRDPRKGELLELPHEFSENLSKENHEAFKDYLRRRVQ